METYIIEGSQQDSHVIRANGDYRMNLSRPLRIESGDEISLKMASIDTQQVDNTSIVINDDLQLSMAFAYYDYCFTDETIPKVKVSDGVTAPADTCEPHLFYYTNPDAPNYASVILEEYAVFQLLQLGPSSDISWGTYTPGQNNISISFSATWVDTQGKIQTSTFACDSSKNPADFPQSGIYRLRPQGDLTQQLPSPNQGKFEFLVNQPDAVGTWNDGSWTISNIKFLHGYPIPNIDVSDKVNEQNFNIAPFIDNPSRTKIGPNENLVVRTKSITLPKGVYNPYELAQRLTIILNQAKPILLAPEGTSTAYSWSSSNDFLLNIKEYEYGVTPQHMQFKSLIDGGNDYYYDDATPGEGSIMIGANNVVIEYGKAGGVFQLSQSFTNLVDPNNKPTPATGVFAYNNRFSVAPQATGIVFTDLQPQDFWQNTLGLYDQMIAPIEVDNTGLMTIPTLENYMTFGAFVNANMVPGLDRAGITQAEAPRFFNLTGIDNIPILGSPPNSQADKSGYYLIEARHAGLNSNYIDNTSNRQAILGVVSKQYIQANAVTGFEGDAAIPYIHRGLPFDMTYVDIRILDGFSKEVDDQLGEKNTVFIKVVKPQPQPFKPMKKK